MKLWILTNPPPVPEDTAYLVGYLAIRFAQIVVTQVAETDVVPPPAPAGTDAVFNYSFNTVPRFLQGLDQLAENQGIPVINPGAATLRACDKRSYIDDYAAVIPQTWVARSLEEIVRLQVEVGDELVLKDPYGKYGMNIIRFAGEKDSEAAGALLARTPEAGVVAQVFCRNFMAGDKRVIVHRDSKGDFETAAWFGRVPGPGSWISNYRAGGRIVPCGLDDDERAFAREIAVIAGLDYVGIDMARQDGRCLLIETNAYTGGHINFDTEHRGHSGDDFAKMVVRLAEQGRR